jgi:hypothetical protein
MAKAGKRTISAPIKTAPDTFSAEKTVFYVILLLGVSVICGALVILFIMKGRSSS